MTHDEQATVTLADLPRNLRLLVVDDNPINILFMKQFFKDISNVHTVNNGGDALQFLDQHAIDVVITDVNMPGMSGVELLERIRERKQLNTIKILAISADISTLKYDEENQAQAFFNGLIEKPFTETEIVKTILKALTTTSEVSSTRNVG